MAASSRNARPSLLAAARSRRRPGAAGLRLATAAALTLLVLAACSPPPAPPGDFEPIASRFDADTEGWTSAEDQAPTWQAPGYLSVVDDDIGWQYAIAPARFHGDWTGAETLSFRVLVDDGLIEHPLRVMISGPDHALYVAFPLDDLVSGEWVAFSVPLKAGRWLHFDGEDVLEGPVATPSELAATLAAVQDLRIRLDLTEKFSGDEVNGVDDVVVE